VNTAAQGPPSPQGLTVLVIDDEPDVLAYLSAVLEQAGHRALIANNANDGFDLLKSQSPDVACIDIVMPEETGVALYRRIRADPEIGRTPVVFITALSPEMAASGWSAGGDDIPDPEGYIEKPPRADAFLETVLAVAASGGSR
jgi:CheY-like chemotaxis protein